MIDTMQLEWRAWQEVVTALKNASAAIDINEEPHLAAAIEFWGETLVVLRLDQTTRERQEAFEAKASRVSFDLAAD